MSLRPDKTMYTLLERTAFTLWVEHHNLLRCQEKKTWRKLKDEKYII